VACDSTKLVVLYYCEQLNTEGRKMSDKRSEQLKSHESEKSSGGQSYKNQQKKTKKCSVMSVKSDLFVPDKFIIGRSIKRKMDNPDKCDRPKTKKSKLDRSDTKSSIVTSDENFTLHENSFCEKRYKNGKDKYRRSKQASTELEHARPTEEEAKNLRANKDVVENRNAVKFYDTAPCLQKDKGKTPKAKKLSQKTTKPMRHSPELLRIMERKGLDVPKQSSKITRSKIADEAQDQSLFSSKKRSNTVIDTLETTPKAKKPKTLTQVNEPRKKYATEIPVEEAEPRINRDECDKESCSQSESEKSNMGHRAEETEKQINKNDHEKNYAHAKDENAFHEKYTFNVNKRLGFSGFVYLGTRKKDKINVAVKFVRKNDELTKYYQCETCLKDKHNQNSFYFNMYDIYDTESLCIYIMEYQEEYLNLPTYIRKVKNKKIQEEQEDPLPEWNTFKMFKKIKEASEILKIAIKPENIMVNTITEEIKINETNECCSFWHRRICEEPKCIFQTCARKNSKNMRANKSLDEKGNAVKCDDTSQDECDKESWSQSESEFYKRDHRARICKEPKCIFQTGVGKELEENIVRSLGLNLACILGLSYLEDEDIKSWKRSQGWKIPSEHLIKVWLLSSKHLICRCLEEKSENRISLMEILHHPWFVNLGSKSYIYKSIDLIMERAYEERETEMKKEEKKRKEEERKITEFEVREKFLTFYDERTCYSEFDKFTYSHRDRNHISM
jgi:serine/threonine protein kinase